MKLYGKNPVLERLKTDPRSIKKIYISQGHGEAGYIRTKAQKWGIPVFIVPATKIQKLARNLNTQGLLAETDSFPYHPWEDVLALAKEKNCTLVFLDGLMDPQNLGGIIRSLACFGDFAVVLPTHHSVEVTDAVLRVASGGENYVPVAKVGNLNQAIAAARAEGVWIAGAVVEGGQDIREVKFTFPMGIVIGSEQKGIREVIREKIDLLVTLRMAHPRLSMNAAHAATVFCFEIMRQRGGPRG